MDFLGVSGVVRLLVAAKILTLYSLTKSQTQIFNQPFWGSAIIYTFIVMLLHFFTEILGLNFTFDFQWTDILFKFFINFFPALFLFWWLERSEGLKYWVIWGAGTFYFIFITQFTVMV
jgi:hypothetical protein